VLIGLAVAQCPLRSETEQLTMSKRSLFFVDERTSTAALHWPQPSTEVDSIENATIRTRVTRTSGHSLSGSADHEFGGQHTELKLSVVESYLKAYTRALRSKFENLWYIDAFAGTGARTVRTEARGGDLLEEPVPEQIEQRRGSAQVAIDVTPSFDRIIFIESKAKYCAALRKLAAKHPTRDIAVVEEDANRSIRNAIAWDKWQSTRAALFLDPYGMQVHWDTLRAVAATQAIDTWFLFPLAGLYRQATRDILDIDQSKREALTRIFGSAAWENELYAETDETPDLFGHTDKSRRRLADVAGLERYVKARLETIFPKVLKPLPLPIDRRPQLFSLFLCISNPDPRAIGLASKIGDHILKVRMSGMAS
jgi:three-Cys-motif partner protein